MGLISTNVHQLACATSLRKLRRSVISRKLSVDRYSRTRERRRCAEGPAELSRRNAMRRRWGNMRCSPGSPRSVRAFRAIELRLSGTLRSLGSPAVATLQRTPIRRARAQRPRSPTGTAAPTEADPLFGPPTRKAEKPCRAMRPPTSVASAIHASVESPWGLERILVCLPRPKTLDFRHLANVMLSPAAISWRCPRAAVPDVADACSAAHRSPVSKFTEALTTTTLAFSPAFYSDSCHGPLPTTESYDFR